MEKISFCHSREGGNPDKKQKEFLFMFVSGSPDPDRGMTTIKKGIFALLISFLTFNPFYSLTYAAPEINTEAVNYLKSKPPSPWTTLALVAAGEQNLSGDHLKTNPGTQAINYTAPIMAIAALGHDPRTYPSEDFVAKLKTFHGSGQIGDVATLNDDIFGILALVAAGEPTSDSAIQDAKTTVLNNQGANGGWPFAVGGTPDTNMTAMAIMALVEAGVAQNSSTIQNGLNYLRAAQNNDGGFPYDPQSPYGTASDASSDAWVASALYALNIDPTRWEKNGNDPIEHLKTLQTTTGYFQYQNGTGEDAFSPITTSYAAIALAGKGYPVAKFIPTTVGAPAVSFRILGSTSTICAGNVNAATALAVVENAASQCGYTYVIQQTSFGPYLSQINNDAASGVVGWRYRVNNVLPSIGAADYQLATNDAVLWYFGDSDEPRDAGGVVDLRAQIVSDGGGSTPTSTISFIVNPDMLDFGELKHGAAASKTLQIINTGTVGITIEALVTGSDLFTQNLKLDGGRWADYSTMLAKHTARQVEASLTVPGNTPVGDKDGMLIFWAIAQ